MKRLIEADLLRWKQHRERKPLLLSGIRQVGKTWTVEAFGKQHYKEMLVIITPAVEQLKQYHPESRSHNGRSYDRFGYFTATAITSIRSPFTRTFSGNRNPIENLAGVHAVEWKALQTMRYAPVPR